jgi:hypothetical protein
MWHGAHTFYNCANSHPFSTCWKSAQSAQVLHGTKASKQPKTTQKAEELIRALSVSLLAVAAIAASLLLSREKHERTLSDRVAANQDLPADEPLDAIRAAGL